MQSVVQNLRNVIKFTALVAILVAAYLFAAEVDIQRDMMEANIYSLTERSRTIARKIRKPTTLYFFHTPSQTGSQIEPERVRTLLKQYARVNANITFSEVDHTRRPNLAQKHGVTSNNTILIQSAGRTKKLGTYDLLKITGRRRRSSKFKGEAAITASLLKMTQATDRVVYFATGHGEYSHKPARRATVSKWAKGLREEGYSVEPINLLTDAMPDTRNLIVSVGPSRAYSNRVLTRLSKWYKKGGNLILAASPQTAPSVNLLTKPTGIRFEAHYIIDQARKVRTLQSLVNPFVFAPKIKSHPAVESIKDQGLGIQTGRSTSIKVSPDTAQKLLVTSGEAFAKPANSDDKIKTSFNPETDERGPFTIGAVSTQHGSGKLLAFGSPTLFANNYLGQAPGNEDFALNLVNWIFDRAVSIGIRATPSNYNQVTVTANQANSLQIIALGVIPLGIILWGGWVWWSRKNR
ncbi:MAG: DUF4350 domain-containing protein [bacterium]